MREALRAFDEQGWLREFCTPLSWRPDSVVSKIVPGKVRRQCERRSYSATLRNRTRTAPIREAGRLFASSVGWRWPVRHEVGPWSIDAVCRSLDAWVAKRLEKHSDLTAVYAYEDAAEWTFKAARERGLKTIYEHPVGYWRDVKQIFEEERDLQPDYAVLLQGIEDSVPKRERKDREISQADLIVVPSSYSARTLQQAPGLSARISVVNYGAPDTSLEEPQQSDGKLRVMFVGSVQQRKGISYFVEGCRQVQDLVDVTVLGSRVGDCKPLDDFLGDVRYIPSAPHAEVLETMRGQHVLVLPSLSEGFGLVVLEAMSQGMTVIVSENTGAGDVVQNGVEGFVVPIRSSEAIAERLEMLAKNRDRLETMRIAALQQAKRCTWENYRSNLIAATSPYVGGSA